ncbi:acylphosphatase [Hephaestia sp. GCM10023244]|uniref:acylphosphatase n=1 Tax=unclassified Hephaestia TaxID=2631281 RepID=UPI0020778576|nr:acylphosphatase [Hephaestia sp. MAHUQ-44]MCM8731331.1 acylphosphatase [Hephaestia sp. MAHUQ-44]
MTVTQRILVTGRVQGVGYRNWTMGAARDLKLRGWVRNLNGSDVEILATGDEEAIAVLVEACHQGPRLAQVDRVDVQPAEDTGWKGFTKRFGG